MEGLYGATRGTDSLLLAWSHCTSSPYELFPHRLIRYSLQTEKNRPKTREKDSFLLAWSHYTSSLYDVFPYRLIRYSLQAEKNRQKTRRECEPLDSGNNLARAIRRVCPPIHDLAVAMMWMIGLRINVRVFSFVIFLR